MATDKRVFLHSIPPPLATPLTSRLVPAVEYMQPTQLSSVSFRLIINFVAYECSRVTLFLPLSVSHTHTQLTFTRQGNKRSLKLTIGFVITNASVIRKMTVDR